MSTLLPILAFVGAMAWVAWARWNQRALETAIAAALDLQLAPTGGAMSGLRQGVAVEVVLTTRGSGRSRQRCTRLAAITEGCMISAAPERLGGATIRGLTGGMDLLVGDGLFDAEVVVSGDPLQVAATLDADTREAILRHLSRGGTLRSGRVELEFLGHPASAAAVAMDLDLLVELALRLSAETDPAVRLATIVREDRQSGVRRVALRHLARLDDCAAQAAAAALRTDPDLGLRTTALLVLHDDDAIGALGASELAEVATAEPHPICRALTRAGAEAALVALLDVREAQIAAAEGLARVGTLLAVPRLRTLEAARSRDVAAKATAALVAIQARVGDFGDGRVSIAEAGGEVSVVAGGELSVVRGREVR